MSYPKPLPVDRNRTPMQEYPPAASAIGVTFYSFNPTSSLITFNDNTSVIEVATINGGAAIRWIAPSATNTSVLATLAGANFDHIIPKDTYRKFVVPKVTMTVSSIVGINIKEGLFNRVAVVSLGNSSVATTEY